MPNELPDNPDNSFSKFKLILIFIFFLSFLFLFLSNTADNKSFSFSFFAFLFLFILSKLCSTREGIWDKIFFSSKYSFSYELLNFTEVKIIPEL